MQKHSCGSANALLAGLLAGCATVTPQYSVRPTPVPEESAAALEIEREISAIQGREFAEQGARQLGLMERVNGLPVQEVVDRLSRVTERPALHYRAYLYTGEDPNAAALADGRIYLSTGMLEYLAGRGGRVDELAVILGHELAHTAAQHLVKRFRTIQQQQLIISLVAAGASAVTRDAGSGVQQAGRLAVDAASLLQDVAISGFSQEQELEADQLGIRYVARAGFDPKAALPLLEDFARFDNPWPFLRTHPYMGQRRADLERYLRETGQLEGPAASAPASFGDSSGRQGSAVEEERRRLRQLQKLYPEGSVSWSNLQRQIDALDP